MRLFKPISGLAFAAVALAQSSTLYFTNAPDVVRAGQPYNIHYRAPELEKPVNITLRKGNPGNLDTVSVLNSAATGGSYTWTPSTSLYSGNDYAFEITQGNLINYSKQFTLAFGAPAKHHQPLSPDPQMHKSSSTSSTKSPFPKITPGPVHVKGGIGSSHHASMGHSIPVHRNHTFSKPTITKTHTHTSPTHSGGGSSSSSGAAATLAPVHSNLAFAVGFLGAVIYLN